MKPIKTLLLGAGILAMGVGGTYINQAEAAMSGSSEYVDHVNLTLLGQAPVINIHNVAGDKHITSLNLKVQETEIEYTISGSVQCKKINTHVTGAYAFFGPLGMNGFGNLVSNATLHSQNGVAFADLNDKIVEYAQDEFVIPLNKIKNGNPALRVDPLAELEKARQAFNGTDLEFYSQDRELVIQRPISYGANCSKKNNPNKVSQGFETKMGAIQIKYKGDAALHNKAKLKAQLLGNVPNQFQAGEQPLKITSMKFSPNMPNHVGACPDSQTIRVFFSGQGEGEVKIRINDGGNTIHQSVKIAFDAANGQHHYDFDLNVPNVPKFNLNKTFHKNLKVYVVSKDDDENIWPTAYQYKDQSNWSYRCTPQLNPNLNGNNGGLGGYSNGKNNEMTVKPNLQMKPVNPKPARAKTQ